jgi:hypothetical protein
MAYFPDLSDYEYYGGTFHRPRTKNVGWLARDHGFSQSPPSEEFLDKLWDYCKVSVAQTRGCHECDFCAEHAENGAHKGEKLLLGTSEIRVFSGGGVIYAAPTLIFHYVQRHHYDPPDDFVAALMRTPCPPDPAYFERLQQLRLEWNATSVPQGPRRPPPPPFGRKK